MRNARNACCFSPIHFRFAFDLIRIWINTLKVNAISVIVFTRKTALVVALISSVSTSAQVNWPIDVNVCGFAPPFNVRSFNVSFT